MMRQTASATGACSAAADPTEGAGLRLEVTGSTAELRALAHEWEQLWHRSPNASPFNHPIWVLTWLDHFLGADRLHAVLVHRGNDLVGVVPLVRTGPVSAAGLRPVVLVAGAEMSDDGEPLLGPDPAPVATAVAEHLRSLVGRGVGCVQLLRLPGDGPLAQALAASDPAPVELTSSVHLSMRFDDDPDPAARLRKTAKKRDVPRSRRRLDEQAPVAFDLRPCTTADFDAFLDLHGARWDDDDEQGLLASSRGRAFAREAVPALGSAGVGMMAALTTGDKPAALELGYRAGDRYVGHKLAINTDLRRFAPGPMLIHEIASAALEADLAAYGMGRGDSSYKRRWCTHEEPIVGLALVAPGRRGHLGLLVARLTLSRRHRSRLDPGATTSGPPSEGADGGRLSAVSRRARRLAALARNTSAQPR